MARVRKGERIPLRVSERDKAIIARAAKLERKSVSEFVLGHAVEAAEIALGMQTRFELDEAQWAEFEAILDAPPRDMPQMRKLLSEPTIFDR